MLKSVRHVSACMLSFSFKQQEIQDHMLIAECLREINVVFVTKCLHLEKSLNKQQSIRAKVSAGGH